MVFLGEAEAVFLALGAWVEPPVFGFAKTFHATTPATATPAASAPITNPLPPPLLGAAEARVGAALLADILSCTSSSL